MLQRTISIAHDEDVITAVNGEIEKASCDPRSASLLCPLSRASGVILLDEPITSTDLSLAIDSFTSPTHHIHIATAIKGEPPRIDSHSIAARVRAVAFRDLLSEHHCPARIILQGRQRSHSSQARMC